MRFPQYSDFFSDPPFGFDLFHRRRQNYDAAVREIPVQFDPFSSLHTFRHNRATDNRSAFSDLMEIFRRIFGNQSFGRITRLQKRPTPIKS